MSEIGVTTRVGRVNELVASTIDNETVMMSASQGKYYGLDPIGSRIWELLETPQRISDICALLQKEYQVESDVCAKDVLAFVNDLYENKIIQVQED